MQARMKSKLPSFDRKKAKAAQAKAPAGASGSAPTSGAPPPSTTHPTPPNPLQVAPRPNTPPMFPTEGEEQDTDATEDVGSKRKAPPGAGPSWKPTNMKGFQHRKTSIRLYPACEGCKGQGYPADCRRPVNSSGACNACHHRKVPCDWSHKRHDEHGQAITTDPPVIRPKRVMRKRAATQKPTSAAAEDAKAGSKGKGKAKAKSASPRPSLQKGKGKAPPVEDDGEPVAKRLRRNVTYKSAEYIENSEEELEELNLAMVVSREEARTQFQSLGDSADAGPSRPRNPAPPSLRSGPSGGTSGSVVSVADFTRVQDTADRAATGSESLQRIVQEMREDIINMRQHYDAEIRKVREQHERELHEERERHNDDLHRVYKQATLAILERDTLKKQISDMGLRVDDVEKLVDDLWGRIQTLEATSPDDDDAANTEQTEGQQDDKAMEL
ncbi:hypothetical protein DENSPDRAFT_885819 [Dentipellis sp. KUC8613]|nr:hypothetical protein DENSPDRAFT_885819 [Dentipellis sp. KUC8613]